MFLAVMSISLARFRKSSCAFLCPDAASHGSQPVLRGAVPKILKTQQGLLSTGIPLGYICFANTTM
jgi:hypothetical protein